MRRHLATAVIEILPMARARCAMPPAREIAMSMADLVMAARSEPQVRPHYNPRCVVERDQVADHAPMVHPTDTADHDGARLRTLMDRAGVSQADLAAALGVSPTAVHAKWIGEGKIARERIPAICRILRCSADELLGLVPIRSSTAIAEAAAFYHVMRPDVRALLEKYLAAPPDGQAALQKVGDALAKPSPEMIPKKSG